MLGREFESWPHSFGFSGPRYALKEFLNHHETVVLWGSIFFIRSSKCKLVERVGAWKLVALTAGQRGGVSAFNETITFWKSKTRYILQSVKNTFCKLRQIHLARRLERSWWNSSLPGGAAASQLFVAVRCCQTKPISGKPSLVWTSIQTHGNVTRRWRCRRESNEKT